MDNDALCPAAMVSDEEDEVIEKSAGGRFNVYCAVAAGLFEYPLAIAMASIV